MLSYQGRHQGERDDLSESPKTFIWNGSKHRRPLRYAPGQQGPRAKPSYMPVDIPEPFTR